MIVAIVAVTGCGSSRTAALPTSAAARVSAAPVPPPRRVAALIVAMPNNPFRFIKPGTVIAARDVDSRAFTDGEHGFGLANLDNETYPAASSDGGMTWRIDGPVFHIDAADGVSGVGYTGAANARTYFAYGSSVVFVTTDAGRHWWGAYLGELVLSVVAQNGQLIAVVQQQASPDTESSTAVTWVYASTDGGRVWRYNDQLGAGQ